MFCQLKPVAPDQNMHTAAGAVLSKPLKIYILCSNLNQRYSGYEKGGYAFFTYRIFPKELVCVTLAVQFRIAFN